MSKTQSRFKSSTGTQVQPPSPDVNFKIGARACIKSTHPIFPSIICTISALPSPDAAIVELEDKARERILLKYLEPLPTLEQADKFGADEFGSTRQISQNNSIAPPPGNHSDTTSIVEELSPDEERERHRLELKVERAFYEAGVALRDLRDKRLYRSTHKTFEQYCIERFAFARRRPYQLIDAASVVENLCTNCTQIKPSNEGQVRPLTALEPQIQVEAWQQALDLADGKVPTGKIVKGVVERLLEKPLFLADQYCSVGEIFRLQRLRDDDQKYNGWWAIALEVENRLTVKCQVYDKTIEIRQENILRIDMDKEQYQLQQEVIERVSRLARCNLDPVVWAMLEVLNRQTYYTNVQMKLLETAEQLYGVFEFKN